MTISWNFDDRVKLAFDGKLDVKEVSRDEIWPEPEAAVGIQLNAPETTVTLLGVLPLAIGLFPLATSCGHQILNIPDSLLLTVEENWE